MTVIAVKDGIMAADTASWHSNVDRGARVSKIVHLPDGSLFGAAGWLPVIEQAREWLADGADPEKRPAKAEADDLSGCLMRPDGSLWSVSFRFDIYPEPAGIDAQGAHNEFLYGAMLAGASAEEAVRLAIRHCTHAGGEVQVERLDGLFHHPV
mgnify:CR=1 FL=1